MNFWQPRRPIIYNKIILKKHLKYWTLISLRFFCVQGGQSFEAQWDFKLSEDFEINDIFLRTQRFDRFKTVLKYPLCLKNLLFSVLFANKESSYLLMVSFSVFISPKKQNRRVHVRGIFHKGNYFSLILFIILLGSVIF